MSDREREREREREMEEIERGKECILKKREGVCAEVERGCVGR